MRTAFRLSLIAAAIVLGACASMTEPTSHARQAGAKASHSGYIYATGDKCSADQSVADSTCTGNP